MANAESIVSGMPGRYAAALHELALQSNASAQTGQALSAFRKLIDENADLKRLVKSPAFSADEQQRAVAAVLTAAKITGLPANFIKLVAQKRRLFAIGDMISAYDQLDDAHNGVVRAEAVVAAPLNETQAGALRKQLTTASGGKKVEIDVKVDPSILGGMIVKMGSSMIDASLKSKLNALRTKMKEVG